jgi:hypothetical protein
MDPAKAIVEVERFLYATSQLAQTTLRSVLGQAELDELLAEREKINKELQSILDEHTDPWGIKVSAVEVKHVDLPEEMKRAIEDGDVLRLGGPGAPALTVRLYTDAPSLPPTDSGRAARRRTATAAFRSWAGARVRRNRKECQPEMRNARVAIQAIGTWKKTIRLLCPMKFAATGDQRKAANRHPRTHTKITKLMLSIPPAITTSAKPAMILVAPTVMAFNPDAQILFTVMALTSLGSPA